MTQDASTMPSPAAAVHDAARLDALRASGLLDSAVEEQFDRLTRLASKLLRAPATFFSLVDADRDFYKSCFGFPEPLASGRELTGATFCHYSLVSDGALVIPDTRADPVYARVPTVESLGVAAYLGVPVRAPGGEVLGSFCAIDFTPRAWTPLEIDTMKELATSAEREVAIRHWMREQAEQMRRERDARLELENVMESRAALIRGFTHDVKNPLGAADGYLALLEEGVYGTLAGAQRDAILRARRSIGGALNLVVDLIDIARSESKELPITDAVIDVSTLVQELAQEYRAQAEAKGLRLTSAVAPDLPTVCGDDRRIHQILANFLSNAVKYTVEGSIWLTADLDVGPGGKPAIIFGVRDSGPGIPAADIPTLFREFRRLAPERAEGAGIGLAISKRLADALGGRIAVSSKPGVGSHFTLTLPAGTDN